MHLLIIYGSPKTKQLAVSESSDFCIITIAIT